MPNNTDFRLRITRDDPAPLDKTKMPKSNTILAPYRVTLHEETGNKFSLVFNCMAEDEDHAVEQAENSYPGCEIISALPVGDHFYGTMIAHDGQFWFVTLSGEHLENGPALGGTPPMLIAPNEITKGAEEDGFLPDGVKAFFAECTESPMTGEFLFLQEGDQWVLDGCPWNSDASVAEISLAQEAIARVLQ